MATGTIGPRRLFLEVTMVPVQVFDGLLGINSINALPTIEGPSSATRSLSRLVPLPSSLKTVSIVSCEPGKSHLG